MGTFVVSDILGGKQFVLVGNLTSGNSWMRVIRLLARRLQSS
jgi:hypothetical protein